MNCNDLGVKVSRHEFLQFLNGVKGGQYFFIRGYTNEERERADYFLRFGVKYENLRKHDINILKSVLSGEVKFNIQIKHGVWVPNEFLTSMDKFFVNDPEHNVVVNADYILKNQDGEKTFPVHMTGSMSLLDTVRLSNKKSFDKTPVMLSYTLDSTHPLVLAAIGEPDAKGTLLGGLEGGQKTSAYEREAKSCYSTIESDGTYKWYLRDVMMVYKDVHVEGLQRFEASLPINAVKETIRETFLSTWKYRQFILTEGKFDSLTIEGQAVMIEDNDFYMALPEQVSKAFKTEKIQI